jgi:hypothetical protein
MALTPGGCPPATEQTTFDVRDADSCIAMLQALLRAYITVVTGQRRVIVRFNDRWTEYQKSDASSLLAAYQTFYAQCPTAAAEGLPDLNPQKKVRRGPPGRGFHSWPRL